MWPPAEEHCYRSVNNKPWGLIFNLNWSILVEIKDSLNPAFILIEINLGEEGKKLH
jgi:hypothetical protein